MRTKLLEISPEFPYERATAALSALYQRHVEQALRFAESEPDPSNKLGALAPALLRMGKTRTYLKTI